MKISVVVPVYEVEPFIQATMRSIAEQTRPADEVVIVDDASRDRSVHLAMESFPLARVVEHRTNRGLAAARNSGADASTGDLIMFLDADDRLRSDALDVLERRFLSQPTIAAAIPRFHVVVDGVLQPSATSIPADRLLSSASMSALLWRNPLYSGALVRREAWAHVRYAEELRMCEDLDFWLRLLAGRRHLLAVGERLVYRTVGRDGALTTRTAEMRMYRRLVAERILRSEGLPLRVRAVAGSQVIRSALGEAALAPNRRDRALLSRNLRSSDIGVTKLAGLLARTPGVAAAASAANRLLS